MDEQGKTNDIEFDIQQYINLKNIVANRHAAEMAASYIGDYYNNRDVPFLKPILLVGRNSCTTMARAISHSFGNETFRYVCGTFFSAGCLELNNYYSYGDFCSTYYIANIDKLSPLNQYKLWRIFVECRINYIDVETKIPMNVPLRKHLHIFSAQSLNAISKPLLDQMGIILNIAPLTEGEIFQVLKQRAKLMNLTVESDDILIKVAKGSAGLVHRAIEILSLSIRLMGTENQNDVLMTKHVDRALFLDEKNTEASLKNMFP